MEIGQLEAFEAAARLGSFSQTAEELNLSQPAISKRITTLEATLGTDLFERTGHQLKLTELGTLFLPYAEQALNVVRQGKEVVQRYQQGLIGEVRVAALDVPASYLLPDPVRRFRREYPSVDFAVLVRSGPQIVKALHNGRLDVGLMGTRILDKQLEVLARFVEPISAMAAPHHPLVDTMQAQGSIAVSDLYEHTIFRVTLNRDVTDLVEQIVENSRQGSGGAVVWVNGLLAVDMLIEGQGIAFLPEYAVMEHLEAGRLVRLAFRDLHPLQNELILIKDKEHTLNTPTTAFVDMLSRQWRHIRVT